MYCDTCKLIAKREACARFYERQKNCEAPPKKRKPKVEKKRYFEKCMDCGCAIYSETDKRCAWCRDKKKSKSKKIDPKWLVRGNISSNTSACAMMES